VKLVFRILLQTNHYLAVYEMGDGRQCLSRDADMNVYRRGKR
jgi:hypothetical protein